MYVTQYSALLIIRRKSGHLVTNILSSIIKDSKEGRVFIIIKSGNEVGKVLDARSVLARRYGRQKKGRRLYSVLARRKKGKEKISQIE